MSRLSIPAQHALLVVVMSTLETTRESLRHWPESAGEVDGAYHELEAAGLIRELPGRIPGQRVFIPHERAFMQAFELFRADLESLANEKAGRA